MQYTQLGRTGLEVSRIALGTMHFGELTDETAAFEIMDRALEAGINLFDTADVYGGPQTPWMEKGSWHVPTRVDCPLRGLGTLCPCLVTNKCPALCPCNSSLATLKASTLSLFAFPFPKKTDHSWSIDLGSRLHHWLPLPQVPI